MRFLARPLVGAALSVAAPAALLLAPVPAAAIPVFDPANYAQNVLQAARSLEQINHQIQSLQNEATMIQNMAKNLERLSFPQLGKFNTDLQKITQLMGQGQAIGYQTNALDRQFTTLFPGTSATTRTSSAQTAAAKARLDAAMAAFRQTMNVQAQVAENAKQDAAILSQLAAASQGSEGSLQAQQASNQLLALVAKQQLQLQSLLASAYRAEALEDARRAQAESDGRAATLRFLGSGRAYTPD
ncbi:MAG TPA: P-type conjugative transfer protein TrbJ [Allosphingosinicella sp.]|jgi:P-type conjugative transfer protein TrbJ|nr:P-type conjugative transfer protein TrbJ [Allosphingosinicella sp.]